MKNPKKQANEILRDDNKRLRDSLEKAEAVEICLRGQLNESQWQNGEFEKRIRLNRLRDQQMADSLVIERNDLVTRIQRIDQRLRLYGIEIKNPEKVEVK